MKLGIAGKGGTGKTTVVGTMARSLGRLGHRVIAFDVDPHPTLATTVGVDLRRAADASGLPPDLFEAVTGRGAGPRPDIAEVVARYGIPGPDRVTVVIAHRLEHVEMHCNSGAHAIVRAMLRDLVQQADDVALVDMEAGVEHFSRAGGTLAHADGLLIMIEPFHKSLVTGRTVAGLAAELGIPHRYVVANKVRRQEDMRHVDEFCELTGLELLGTVPWDTGLQEAERRGVAPIDHCPDSPGVMAACELATRALGRLSAAADAVGG